MKPPQTRQHESALSMNTRNQTTGRKPGWAPHSDADVIAAPGPPLSRGRRRESAGETKGMHGKRKECTGNERNARETKGMHGKRRECARKECAGNPCSLQAPPAGHQFGDAIELAEIRTGGDEMDLIGSELFQPVQQLLQLLGTAGKACGG